VVVQNVAKHVRGQLLAVDALCQFSRSFLVHFRDVFFLLVLRAEESGTLFGVVALDGLRFVVRSNVVGQVRHRFFAVNAGFHRRSAFVVVRNVFVPLLDGQEIIGTVLVKVAFDGFIFVLSFYVIQHVYSSFLAVNAVFLTFLALVNFRNVRLSFFFGFEINGAPLVELALDDFIFVMRFYVVVAADARIEHFAFAAVDASEFAVHSFVVELFFLLV